MFYIIKSLANTVRREVKNTISRPERIKKLRSISSINKFIRFQKLSHTAGSVWSDDKNGSLAKRKLRSYDDYLMLQASKIDYIDLEKHERRFRFELKERIRDLDFVVPGCNVLCLGARLGAEVGAFRDVHCFAVGIDLNPGKNNAYVLYGDFQELHFQDECVDIVYTNSLDHAFDIKQVVSEILRVLKSNGRVIVEPDPGIDEGDRVAPDMWQTLCWKTIADLIDEIEQEGLTLIFRRNFEYPRNGQQLVFVRTGQASGVK